MKIKKASIIFCIVLSLTAQHARVIVAETNESFLYGVTVKDEKITNYVAEKIGY